MGEWQDEVARRRERRLFIADLGKHAVWVGVALYGVTSLTGAVKATHPPVVTVQPGVTVTPEAYRAAVQKLDVQIKQRGLGPNVTLNAGNIWEFLTPLVSSGEVAPATASELVRNVIQGGREIAVDSVSQFLERALREKPTVAATNGGVTVTQTCAPILTVEAPRPVAPPRSTTPPRPTPSPQSSTCPIEK